MRKAKIQHAHVALRRDHHVAGFEIHVQYTARVRVGHGIAEIVQDAGGDWVERMSTLELQESKENGK